VEESISAFVLLIVGKRQGWGLGRVKVSVRVTLAELS
jgi:hypothetical protein